MENLPTDKINMTSLFEVIENVKTKGFTHEFSVNENGEMASPDIERTYKAGDVKIIDFFRFEGDSDPADESILYTLETVDGTKGVLSHIYGQGLTVEGQQTHDFMRRVRTLHEEHPLSMGSATTNASNSF